MRGRWTICCLNKSGYSFEIAFVMEKPSLLLPIYISVLPDMSARTVLEEKEPVQNIVGIRI